MNAKAKTAPEENSNLAALAEYGFDHLPEAFSIQDDLGNFNHEREACFRCVADGFYGRGTAGTWYMEGSIIVADMVPNEHLQPLNRAAGLAVVSWLRSLPQHRAQFDIGDMAEAAQILAKDPQVTNLSPLQYQQTLIKLCEEIKLRREGKSARTLPSMGHNFTQRSANGAPPILGAKLSDMTQRGPGQTQAQAVIPGNQQGGVRRASPALGGNPPLP